MTAVLDTEGVGVHSLALIFLQNTSTVSASMRRGMWFSGFGGPRLTVGLDGLCGPFQP